MSEQKPKKLATSREVYNRIRWDASYDPGAYIITYEDRVRGMKEVPLPEFVPDGDIPWHRVWFIRDSTRVVWDRKERIDLICNPASKEPKPPIAKPRAVSVGGTVTFEPRSARRYDAKAEAWSADVQAPSALAVAGLLRVVTYNVLAEQLVPDVPTQPRWRALLNMLRRSDADVIGLQEVTDRFLEVLLREPWVRSTYAVSEVPGGADIDAHGQVVLSRFPVLALWCATYSKHKRVVLADLDVGGWPLTVAVVHLSSSRATKSAAKRARQLRILLDELDSEARLERDALIVGDFNCVDDELGVMHQRGWRDTWSCLQSDDPGFTFDPATNTVASRTSQSGLSRRFDRIFWRAPSARFEAVDARLMGTQPLDGAQWGSSGTMLFASDHYGVSVLLRDVLTLGNSVQAAPVYQSAVVLLPPDDTIAPIQAIRKHHDRGFERWMPHINLLYGFIPDAGFDEAAQLIAGALAGVEPFELEFAELDHFQHRATVSVWLRPEVLPESALLELQALLERLFPQCSGQSRRGSHGFVPHLTIASLPIGDDATRKQKAWGKAWTPFGFEVDSIALISRRDDDPFEIRHRIRLGGVAKHTESPLQAMGWDASARQARAAVVLKMQALCAAALATAEGGPWGGGGCIAGSTRLGVDVPGSDLDLVCVGAHGLKRAIALPALQHTLASSDGVVGVRWIGGPGGETLRCAIDGWDLDLQYVEAPAGASPFEPERWGAAVLDTLGEEALQAVRGIHEIDQIRDFAVQRSAWHRVEEGLKALKIWARARDIDIKALGYPGGISLALVSAWALDHGADGALSTAAWLARVFDALDAWDGYQPISPNPSIAEQWRSERRDRMAIVSIVDTINTARHVTRSTVRVLRREWRRGLLLAQAIESGQGTWTSLFEPIAPPLGDAIGLKASADGMEETLVAKGWLTGHALGLILELEQSCGARVRPRGRRLPHAWDVVLCLESYTGQEAQLESACAMLRSEFEAWPEKPKSATLKVVRLTLE